MAEAGGAFRFGRWATSGGGAAAAAATRTAARNPSERVVATLNMGRLRARKGCGPAAYPARGSVASCGLGPPKNTWGPTGDAFPVGPLIDLRPWLSPYRTAISTFAMMPFVYAVRRARQWSHPQARWPGRCDGTQDPR